MRLINSNTSTTIVTDRAWTTMPSTSSTYKIIHTGTPSFIQGRYDGKDTDKFFLPNYPIKILESVNIDSTTVAVTDVFQYEKKGKLVLSNSAARGYFTSKKAQLNHINYWFGVYPIPYIVKRLTAVIAAIQILNQQMGGTFDDPSTYTLPEGSVSVGQAYINIEGTIRRLDDERQKLESQVIKYLQIG
jgi:hypothetical protein